MTDKTPFIVGLGGTSSSNSTSECILRQVMAKCAEHGAEVQVFDGPSLNMPMYAPDSEERSAKAQALVAALRRADGVVIASPGYHGSVSGLIKNALDYVQDMAKDERVYFEGRAVGLIAVAAGWQATGSTLATLRSITHALRGWPTPMAVAVNSMMPVFDARKQVTDPALLAQFDIVAGQVVDFARMRALHDLACMSHAAGGQADF